jgi:hypothetical protein
VTQVDLDTGRRRPSTWGAVVAVSAGIMLGAAAGLGIWWLASDRTQIATYSVRGAVNGVALDLAGASADVVGGGEVRSVQVRRTDHYSFGRRPDADREVARGVLQLRSRCPVAVLSRCQASYRITVPDNMPVTVRTSSGDVRITAFRGPARIDTGTGDIAVGAYCGFSLRARARAGSVQATASCAPYRLELRSGSGDVRAVVPAGRYRVDADAGSGSRSVEGVMQVDDAPFQIQAISSTGDVAVESRR